MEIYLSSTAQSHDLLTPNQMAEFLGVTVGTLAVWRCTKRYALPYIKVGRSVRYSRAHGYDFIASRTVGADALPI